MNANDSPVPGSVNAGSTVAPEPVSHPPTTNPPHATADANHTAPPTTPNRLISRLQAPRNRLRIAARPSPTLPPAMLADKDHPIGDLSLWSIMDVASQSNWGRAPARRAALNTIRDHPHARLRVRLGGGAETAGGTHA